MATLFRYLCIAACLSTTRGYYAAPSSKVESAQPSANPSPSLCDKYTMALLGENTAANQKLLLTLVVNTAVIGNYTQPNVGIKVKGILSPGMYNGVEVNLLKYFDGSGYTTNVNNVPSRVNFLDGGGAVPLKENKPALCHSSNQVDFMCNISPEGNFDSIVQAP